MDLLLFLKSQIQRNVKFNNYTAFTLIILFSFTFVTFGNAQIVEIPDKFTLKKIVIDAGHGGHDNGTSGSRHKEKNLALDYALLVGKKIKQELPGINVIYTRTTDKFIPLKERAQIANRNDADLFISIHCNGGSRSASGTETFVLGLHRNEDNLKVAMRENTSILLEDDYTHHYGNFDPTSPEAYILFNLFQSANLDQSLDIASIVEKQFSKEGRRSRGVKQAGFLVLRETTMPSILVETGFLTNRSDENYLASQQGKEKVAQSIFQAVREYKTNLDKEAERIMMKNEAYRKQVEEERRKAEEERTRKEESAWAWPSLRTVDTSSDTYFVQVLVSKNYDKGEDTFSPFNNIIINRIDIIDSYKYLIGPYSTKEKAEEIHKQAQQNGFRDAYILRYKNGKIVR